MSNKHIDVSQAPSTGGTGGTGTPANTGTTESAVSLQDGLKSLNNPGQTVEDFAKDAAYQGLVGATGGLGQIPQTVELAKEQQVSASAMRATLAAEIDSKSDESLLVVELKELYGEFTVLQDKANSILAFHAFRMGLYLLRLQAIRYSKNLHDWTTYAALKVPFIKKRTREKYMSLASLPMVEEHLWLGIERLAAMGTYYNGLKDTERETLGPDPVNSLLAKQGFRDDMTFDERKARADAIIEVYKLERLGVFIDPELMEYFLADQDPLSGEERKHLKKLAEEQGTSAPIDLLTKLITKQVSRKDFIPKQDDTAATQQDGETAVEGQAEAPETSLPNVDSLLARASESIKPYVHQGHGWRQGEVPGGRDERLHLQAGGHGNPQGSHREGYEKVCCC